MVDAVVYVRSAIRPGQAFTNPVEACFLPALSRNQLSILNNVALDLDEGIGESGEGCPR